MTRRPVLAHPAGLGALALGLIDVATTWVGLASARAHEANAIPARLLEVIGPAGVFGLRLALGVALVGVLLRFAGAWPAQRPIFYAGIAALLAGWALVDVSNLAIIL